MVPTLIAYLGSALLAWSVWVSISLAKNYRTARSIGLPVVICPVTSLNPLWIIGYRLFPLVLKLRHLPFGLGRWVRSSYFGWNFVEKHAIHDELGDIFAIASPSSIEVVVADPQAAHAIFSRRKDFIKPALLYDQLNLFGRNLDTVEGEDWQRHRKLTAPSFNERTSSLVWDEASRQAKAMLDAWCRLGAKGTRETVRDTATLALHVLTSAGLGVTYEWGQGVQHLPPGHTMSYRESLSVCLQNVLPLNIFSKRVLALNFMPSKTQKIGRALQEFQLYMDEMLAHERSSAAKQSRSWNLMGALVRASEDSDHSLEGKETKHRLTDEEVFGNIFIYNFAGHETTANTVAFALVLLAAYPQYQDWLSEEIHTVVGNSPEEALQYEIVFPKFHRCLAVMFETLRLYGSVVGIPKHTGDRSQEITSRGHSYLLPAAAFVTVNSQALHTDPRTWGPDALAWNPRRWITTRTSPGGSDSTSSNCNNSCQRFAQVEFVAVLGTLFSAHRLKPVLSNGRTAEDAKKDLLSMADGAGISAVSLQMQEPKKVALQWAGSS